MKTEIRIFFAIGTFFGLASLAYGLWTYYEAADGLEPVGTAALALILGLGYMIAGYLWATARRIDPRPEDNPYGEIEEGAGDQGAFSPWSWWPFTLGAAVGVGFLGLAVGWWLLGVSLVLSMISLVGWVYEFSRGQHAH